MYALMIAEAGKKRHIELCIASLSFCLEVTFTHVQLAKQSYGNDVMYLEGNENWITCERL